MTEFIIKDFNELTLLELHNIYLTRGLVFTVGQKITDQDIDDVDLHCKHLFTKDDDGRVLGYIRMFDLDGGVLTNPTNPCPAPGPSAASPSCQKPAAPDSVRNS